MMLSMQSEDLIKQSLVERGAEFVLSGLRYVVIVNCIRDI